MDLPADNSQVSSSCEVAVETSSSSKVRVLFQLVVTTSSPHGSPCCHFCIPPQIRAAASGQSQFASCAKNCAGSGYALTLIGADYSCRCAGSVPPAAALLWDTDCEAGGTGIAAFYNHADAATPCHVEDVPLSNTGFKAAYNAATNIKFAAGGEVNLLCFPPFWQWQHDSGSRCCQPNHTTASVPSPGALILTQPAAAPLPAPSYPADGSMQLILAGTQGTRVQSLGSYSTYGMAQVKAQIPCAEGVVSAFYLRSSDAYADLNAGKAANDFDELDFEFLSHNGLACSVWLNTFKQGVSTGEVQLGQPKYQQALGWPAGQANTGAVTYTIHW